MYGVSSQRTVPQSTVALFATVGCIGLAGFLIASTVILALIPVFLPTKSVTPDPNVLKSKEVVISIEVEGNDTASINRRRRDTSDLYNYVNGTFDDVGKALIKANLLAVLPSRIVHDIDISSISIAYKPLNRRRRLALSKRASHPKQAIVIVIRFFIIYYSTCFYHCQLDKGPILRSILQSMSLTTFDFYGLRIYKYGLFFQIAQRIKCIQIIYVSLILPGLDPITQTYPAITATAAPIAVATTPNFIG